MVKVCRKCGKQAVDDRSNYCTNCGTEFSSSASSQKCPSCGAILNQNSPYCPKCLIIVYPHLVNGASTKLPKTLANNLVSSENSLKCNSCGALKKSNSAYCPECKTIYPLNAAEMKRIEEELIRKDAAEKALKIQQDIAKGIIVKLQNSGNFQLIYNYITRYPNSNVYDKNFSNLKTLLENKGIPLTDNELLTVISTVRAEGELEWVKTRILHGNPTSSDQCIKNYVIMFGNVSENVQNERLIKYLTKILVENYDFQGNLASDLIRIKKEVELDRFENSLTDQASCSRITINDVDTIDGYEFEYILKELFEKMGYHVVHTNLSNDQGADLIVEKFGIKSVVQAKNWQNNVTNSGIQEVVAAIKHYNAQRAMVISSSGFTQRARVLAQSNNVILWDRAILSSMLDENPIYRD